MLRVVDVRALLIPVLAVLSTSCEYAAHRTADFFDQFRFVLGASTGGGVRGRALGLVDTGLTVGIKPHASSMGLRYGEWFWIDPHGGDIQFDSDQSLIVVANSVVDCDYTTADYKLSRFSVAALPALFTWVDATDPAASDWTVPEEGNDMATSHYLWSAHTWNHARAAMVHAFDLELEAGLVVYFDVGYSPGETLDFLLGFLTIDVAADDRPNPVP